MGIKVDLSGVELKTFDPIPYDRVVVKVDDMREETAKRSGAGKIRFIMTILGDLEGHPIPGNRKAFYETSLKLSDDPAHDPRWNLKRTLIALGDAPEDTEGELDLEKADYVDRKAVAVLYLDESKEALGATGKPKQKVRLLLPLPEGWKLKKA